MKRAKRRRKNKLSSKGASATGQGAALEALRQAVSAHQAGRLNEAMRGYRTCLEHEPDNTAALGNLGGALLSLGKLPEAVSYLEKALALHPENPDALSNLGFALTQLGRLEEAVACLQKALALKPAYPMALNNLGNALADLGRIDEAVAAYRESLSLEPGYADAHYNLGSALTQRGSLDEAIACYEKAISIRPDYAEAYGNLGFALTEQGRLDEAMALYRKALTIKPNYAEAHSNLGIALTEQGNLDAAVVSLKRALTIQPDHAGALTNMGSVLEDRGEMRAAVASYQKAMALRLNGALAEDLPEDYPGTNAFFIELTNRCNFHCSFCPSDDQRRSLGEMPLELAEKILDEISTKKLASTINLHLMGEPTLHPHLKEVLRMASARRLKVDLVTNGSTLTESMINSLLDHLTGKLVVSLQTPTEASFVERGTKMAWSGYLGRIQELMARYLERSARGEPLKCEIQVRMMKSEAGESSEAFLDDRESIVRQLETWSDFVGALEQRAGLEPFPRPPIDGLSEAWFARKNASYGLQKGIRLVMWSHFTFADAAGSDGVSLDGVEFCHYPFTNLGILWDGRCVPCCLDYDGQLALGDVNEASLASILMGAKASQMRRVFLGEGELPDYCRSCQAACAQS